jgi:hypothetical protein
MSTKEDTKAEGKKAGEDALPVSLGWNSHKAVVCIQIRNLLLDDRGLYVLLHSPFNLS